MLKNLPTGRYGRYLPIIQSIIDIAIVAGVFILLLSRNVGGRYFAPLPSNIAIEKTLLICLIVAPFTFRMVIAVHQRRMMRAEKLFSAAFGISLITTLLYAALMMFFGYGYVRFVFFVILFAAQFGLLALVWFASALILKGVRRIGRNTRNIVIVGTGQSALRLSELLTSEQSYGMRVLGYFDNRIPTDFPGNILGQIDGLEDFIKENDVHEIFYASSVDNDTLINKIIRISDQNFCKLYFTPLMSPKLQHSFYLSNFNSTIPAIAVHPSPLRSAANRAIKRTFDIVFSTVALILSPLVLIPVGIAIKISSPGPIFFKQLRTGYLGKDFYCYKFRTMKVSADADTRQATKDDDRKTRLGNFLRHTSIDELPQFWNVFKGDMSVVGPRPHMLAHTEEYRKLISQYMVRHLVKPGITGWAQIQGFRGATDELWQMERRVDNDVWYIEHWSLSLDLKIIVRTVTNALSGEENAY